MLCRMFPKMFNTYDKVEGGDVSVLEQCFI